jgi:hypothetical protein
MAFGDPTRYLPIKGIDPRAWDERVKYANGVYSKRMHNIFCDNCHSHVAMALNDMQLYDRRSWNMIVLAIWIFFAGRFPSLMAVVKTFWPFGVCMAIVLAFTM